MRMEKRCEISGEGEPLRDVWQGALMKFGDPKILEKGRMKRGDCIQVIGEMRDGAITGKGGGKCIPKVGMCHLK